MKCLLISILFILSTGCTIHRSEGRKKFESDAPSKASPASLFQLTNCKKSSTLENWLNEEFPTESYELIVSEQDLEIWRSSKKSSIEIKAIQKNNSTIQACIYEFANESVWNAYQEQFIRELENNMMTLE